MQQMGQHEAKRILEKEFEELNAFTNRPGMKKYAYAYAQRKCYNELVMGTIKAGFREQGLYRTKTDKYGRSFQEYNHSDGLIEILDEAVKEYTYQNRDWGKKKHKYHGRWCSPESSYLENINIMQYWGNTGRKGGYRSFPVYNYYSDYFFLNTHQSMVFYDIKTSKMVRGDLTKIQHPIFSCIRDEKAHLKRILEIQNVDIRKNILKQLSWSPTKYAQEADKTGDYRLLTIDFNEEGDGRNNRNGILKRVYLEMKNPSTGETHVEAVHPDCRSVADAINYRRYGTIRPNNLKNQFILEIPNWTPVQLS